VLQRLGGEVRLGDRAIAQVGEPSPFSRSGPGVSGGVKPDVCHFGGNRVLNNADVLVEADFGVSVLSTRAGDGRLFGIANGTSFSARASPASPPKLSPATPTRARTCSAP
jgi:hypothetical protein